MILAKAFRTSEAFLGLNNTRQVEIGNRNLRFAKFLLWLERLEKFINFFNLERFKSSHRALIEASEVCHSLSSKNNFEKSKLRQVLKLKEIETGCLNFKPQRARREFNSRTQ